MGATLAMGDEIISINGQLVYDDNKWLIGGGINSLLACLGMEEYYHVQLLQKRNLAPSSPFLASPLAAGDVLIYDSQTIHWGGPNRDDKTRHVLYAGFMSKAADEAQLFPGGQSKTFEAQEA